MWIANRSHILVFKTLTLFPMGSGSPLFPLQGTSKQSQSKPTWGSHEARGGEAAVSPLNLKFFPPSQKFPHRSNFIVKSSNHYFSFFFIERYVRVLMTNSKSRSWYCKKLNNFRGSLSPRPSLRSGFPASVDCHPSLLIYPDYYHDFSTAHPTAKKSQETCITSEYLKMRKLGPSAWANFELSGILKGISLIRLVSLFLIGSNECHLTITRCMRSLYRSNTNMQCMGIGPSKNTCRCIRYAGVF